MISIIHTPTPDLQKSIDFYKKLNFEVLSETQPTLVSDGKAVIEINPERSARAGIKLYKKSWKSIVTKLEATTKVTATDQGYFLSDPSGMRIYLLESAPPTLPSPKEPSSTLGNYMGVSLETTDMARSVIFWENFGFIKVMGDAEKGWVAYSNGGDLTLSLMVAGSCPHLFFNPSLTYFNGKENMKVIEKIRAAGIPIAEEITQFNKEGIVDNVIICDPGGYGFFVFND